MKVASGHISGKRPAVVDLGVHRLGSDTRLSWVLSGPQNPPATLSFRVVGTNGDTNTNTVPPQKPPNAVPRRDDAALGAYGLKPGYYRVYLSQRFPPSGGPGGYDVSFVVFTEL
jgi:hypothetical protein